MDDGNWTDDLADRASLEFKMDLAISSLLETFQHGVEVLVNAKDARRLQILQACTQETYRRAEQALSLGKKMKIDAGTTQQPCDN